jgi:hypothetical protein
MARRPLQCAAMLADFVTLIRRPLAAIETIETQRSLRAGVVALLLSVALPALLAELGAFGPYRPPADLGSLPSLTMQGADIYARWTYQHRFLLPLIGVLVSLGLWLAGVALIHGVVRALGGRGDLPGFLKLAGYIALLGLLSLPIGLVDAIANLTGNAHLASSTGQLTGLAALGIVVWQNVLLVFAARRHYRVSTERAVGAVIGPIGAVAVLLLALVIVAVATLLVSQPL